MPDVLKVAAIQMDCMLADKKANFNKAEKFIADAAEQGAKLIVLPELFSTGYRVEEQDYELAESLTGPTLQWLQQQAALYDIFLAAAIIELGEDNSLYDTAVLVGSEGLLGSQRKMHLWGAEGQRFARGEQIDVIQLPFAKVGLLICYEIGFPEMARIQTQKGADILIYTSAFGRARVYAWDVASRSRALENGVFVIACNRCGKDKDTDFGGLSRIVAPDTRVLAEAGADGDAVVCAALELSECSRMRETIPYLRDLDEKLCNHSF